jgi:Uncharacterized protein involved in formate dehydrogenase formation
MSTSRQSAEQTIEEVLSWRPVLAPVLRFFAPLLAAQAEVVRELEAPSSVPSLPTPDAERLKQGVSLLAGASLTGLAAPMRTAAEKLLPLLEPMEALAPHMPVLREFFLKPVGEPTEYPVEKPDAPTGNKPDKDSRETLAEALVTGNKKGVAGIARNIGLDPLLLEFVAALVIAPVLRSMVSSALPEEGETPWDEGGLWQQGYCPVCGAMPTVGWLDKPAVDEKNAFLAGGGGKKHLHCVQCGAGWKFLRGACPACGKKDDGTIEILRETGPSHGERLDWCTKCKTYCPTVDLREREFVPDMDALAMGMMHLDMVAARRKLRPLKASFWNLF